MAAVLLPLPVVPEVPLVGRKEDSAAVAAADSQELGAPIAGGAHARFDVEARSMEKRVPEAVKGAETLVGDAVVNVPPARGLLARLGGR